MIVPEAGCATAATTLLADDEIATADLLATRSTGEGSRVLHASDGATAPATTRRVRPAPPLADNTMPAMGGTELAGYLHGHPEFALPASLMSAAPPPAPPPPCSLYWPFSTSAPQSWHSWLSTAKGSMRME